MKWKELWEDGIELTEETTTQLWVGLSLWVVGCAVASGILYQSEAVAPAISQPEVRQEAPENNIAQAPTDETFFSPTAKYKTVLRENLWPLDNIPEKPEVERWMTPKPIEVAKPVAKPKQEIKEAVVSIKEISNARRVVEEYLQSTSRRYGLSLAQRAVSPLITSRLFVKVKEYHRTKAAAQALGKALPKWRSFTDELLEEMMGSLSPQVHYHGADKEKLEKPLIAKFLSGARKFIRSELKAIDRGVSAKSNRGHKIISANCTACRGTGKIGGRSSYGGKVSVTCSRCKGSGKVKRIIRY